METDVKQMSRRSFLGGMTATALTAASYKRVLGANDRVGIGFIGFGLIGKQHIYNFKTSFPDVDRVAMCDVYKPRLDEGLAYLESPGAKGYTDFRKMYEDKNIDGVVVATPDHWHAMLTIMACAAGKDVYVEKPLTVFIDEGKWMLQAMNKYKRVVVVGTQRNHNPGHLEAKKIIESGILGKIQMVKLGAGGRNVYPGFGKTPVENPPADFDYDLWLGPAPKKPYQSHRGLYHFRWFWDYSGGQLTNLGAHSVSAFLLVMGVKGPTRVVSFGGRFTLEDDGETPDLQECLYQFPDFMMTMGVREANGYRDSTGSVVMGNKGNLLLGSNQIVSERHGDPINSIPRFQGHPVGGPVYSKTQAEPWIPSPPAVEAAGGRAQAGAAPAAGAAGARGGAGAQGQAGARGEAGARGQAGAAPGAAGGRGAGGGSLEERMFNANKRDWIDCMKSRKQPFCSLEEGHRTAIICNLGNMSLRLGGRAIQWDPDKEVVVGDKEAAAMCTQEYRQPWDGVLKSILKA
jgi:predicted dehydrogenase